LAGVLTSVAITEWYSSNLCTIIMVEVIVASVPVIVCTYDGRQAFMRAVVERCIARLKHWKSWPPATRRALRTLATCLLTIMAL
jgi:hypothetical protein